MSFKYNFQHWNFLNVHVKQHDISPFHIQHTHVLCTDCLYIIFFLAVFGLFCKENSHVYPCFPKVIAAAAAKKAEEEAAEAARLAAEEEEAARKAAEEAEAAAQMNGHPESLKNPALDGLISGAGMCGHSRVRSVTECKQTRCFDLQVPEEGHTKVQEEARLLPSPLEELKDAVLITVMTSAKKPQLLWSSTMNLNQFSIWVS